MAKRGPKPKRTDVSLMAMWALLVVRIERVKRKRARVQQFEPFSPGDPETAKPEIIEIQVDAFLQRVMKALQRLETGKAQVHPELLKAVGWCDRATGAPIFGTAPELAKSVATFVRK